MSDKKKIRVYYHNADLDGLCSAAIVYRYYGETAEYIGINYGDPFELDPTLDQNLFVDFSPCPPPKIVPANLLVLDHHKTSIGLPGTIDMERAACEIVWDHFHPKQPRPVAVNWIGTADIFRKVDNWESEVVPFCLALETEWPDIKNQLWAKLFEDATILPYLVRDGQAMLRYSRAQNARLLKEQAFTTFFHGYSAVVLIGGTKGSPRFIGYEGKEALQIVVQYRANRRWYYSLRSHDDGPDVCEIAKCYDGGGHVHAAAFSHEDLLV